MTKLKKFGLAILILIAAATAIFLIGWLTSVNVAVRTYEYDSPKINDSVRLALITDLHSCRYGDDQSELAELIKEQQPDIILLGGDIFDDVLPHERAKDFLTQINDLCPCFYVSGNHEYWSGDMDELKDWLRANGITVLEGDCETVEVGADKINICGVDDPTDIGRSATHTQIKKSYESADLSNYTVLLTHRPEPVEEYSKYDFDLIAAGHAHGGQWRLPYILNGLWAPDQGFFPKYAGGEYRLTDGTTMVVSRGLARESTKAPRVFNPPELVMIELK